MKYQNHDSWKNEKNISTSRLLKNLPRVLSVKHYISKIFVTLFLKRTEINK